MYYYVIGDLTSEQLVLCPEQRSKIVIFISDEAGKFGGIQQFCLIEKFGHFTFYGDKYINLVKYEHLTENYV